jgi:AraC-like DNA-binding protein
MDQMDSANCSLSATMSSELISAMNKFMDASRREDGLFRTPIDALRMIRFSGDATADHFIGKPALCIVVQGEKQARFGTRLFSCGPMQALLITLEIPAFSAVREARAGNPYLGAMIELDLEILREVIEQIDPPPPTEATFGVFAIDIDGGLADCLLRLCRLITTPKALTVLYPSIMREICFWLLSGPHASEICKFALPDGHTQRIAQAIAMLRGSYDQTIRVKELASAARMSPSTFHHYFKSLTGMSPLQYQKQIRLLEARRLMMDGAANVESAAYSVGYESASQFSREYARRFGAPPKRDVAKIKQFAA